MSPKAAAAGLALAGVLLLTAGSAQATPGDLDTSFGTGGKVTTDAGGTSAEAGYAVALQSDGKIVVAGTDANDFVLFRYNANGSLDSSFGSGGKVTTAFGTYFDIAHAVAIQSDGKIVAAGESYNGSNTDFALARYNAADGSLDTSFSGDGKATTPILSSNDAAYAVAVRSDNGKILAAGESYNGSNTDFALARYNANGTVDNTFVGGGAAITPIGTGFDEAYAMALQPDNKIVLAGRTEVSITDNNFALVRYQEGGSLDTTFNGTGKVTTDFSSGYDQARAVAVQPDGKIVAAGSSAPSSTFDFALTRYNANGSLDSSFGSGGKVTTAIGSANDLAHAVALQPDGKIVVAGSSDNTTGSYDFALARYNTNGSLDVGFGTNGKVVTPLGTGFGIAYGLALQPDGKPVAAGSARTSSMNSDFALARYLGNTLTVARSGNGAGTVTSSPSGIDCGLTCSAPFAAVPVTLSASPAPGSVFTGWSGGGCSGTGTCQVQMSSDQNVTASFTALRTLSVVKAGSGAGTVSSSPAGIDCGSTCSGTFVDGTPVTLTATAAAGSSFVGWSGDCTGTGNCQLTMGADHTATATFESDKTLTVAKAGTGAGTVTSSPAGIDCGATCSHAFAYASSVTLTATASGGSIFAGWSGDCSGTGTCTLSMTAGRSATATFESPKTITVTKAGGGLGTVLSSPSGINCGATCAHAYAFGTSVTLAATASSTSVFAGWSGACTGTGDCTLSMSADRAVTATFKPLCVVPKVKGKKLRAAKRAIKRAHCSVGRVRRAYSSRVRRGRVIAQKPVPGKKLPAGSKVKLKVSKGKRPR